ncbi:TonB-dependent siderophore receptor [Sphingomonas sp. AP4-R1]|uniref:TonB-dependent receptor n=1 Tax=Sphingomonas sp. AP4-R1 TaxID=2735134 RepID=UPI0014932EBD|nr:TonB-dependent siderophore receptor [Sphingomonas sp. AP4-R1]QJU59950.1 TonB-dependent siderophore receptor [Sphingomonas sp. AP4-R1]
MHFEKFGIACARAALLSSAAATLLLAEAVGAQTTEAARKAVELQGVTVTDSAIDETDSSYKISHTTSATRTDTPLVNVPQSVNIVSIKQINDQAANSIGDAIRYVPGVYSAQGEGNRETLVFRGNSTTGDFFVDGLRDDIQTYRDLYNIERLEVFKGPNAMIFGRGGVGGLINRVTKIADGRQHLAGRVEIGSFDHYRGQVDLGSVVSEGVSLRLTGVYQDSGSYRDGVDYKRWGLNPTATFALGEATTISLGYEHFKDERVADRGVSAYQNVPLRTPRGAFFGDPNESPTDTNTDAGTLYIAHRFSDTVSIRNRTRYADYDKFYQNVFPGTVNTTASVNPVGLPAGSYAPGTIVQIQAYNQATQRKNFINQTDLNATFSTGSIEHTLLVGAEFGHQKTDNIRLEGFFPTATNAQGVQTIFATIASPRVRRPDVQWRAIASSGANHGTTDLAAGYIQDQIEISPMFQIILGVRYEHFVTKVTDTRTVGFPATQQRDFKTTDNLWSPRAGLIFKPIEQASIYASFSKTYLPRGGDQLTGLTISTQSLAPEKYQNYELGAKWDVLPGFNLQAAIFQLDRDNVLALSDPNNAASPTVPIGRQRTKGVELSAAGNITDQLSMVGAYTYSDAKFLDSVSGTVLKGNRVAMIPKQSASLWTRFDPIKPLGVAVGIIHMGRRFAATDNTVSMPGFTRFDGAIYYKLTDTLDVQVNVENIFNKRYFQFAHSNTNFTPASPTAVRAGINARF